MSFPNGNNRKADLKFCASSEENTSDLLLELENMNQNCIKELRKTFESKLCKIRHTHKTG